MNLKHGKEAEGVEGTKRKKKIRLMLFAIMFYLHEMRKFAQCFVKFVIKSFKINF